MGLFDAIRRAVGGDDSSADGDERVAGSDHPDDGPELLDIRTLGPDDFRAYATEVVESADPLSFSSDALERLDEAIERKYDGATAAADSGETTYTENSVRFGSYLGEVLVREYGGEWTDDGSWGVTVAGAEDEVTVAVFDVATRSFADDPVFAAVATRLESELALAAAAGDDATAGTSTSADSAVETDAESVASQPTRVVTPVTDEGPKADGEADDEPEPAQEPDDEQDSVDERPVTVDDLRASSDDETATDDEGSLIEAETAAVDEEAAAIGQDGEAVDEDGEAVDRDTEAVDGDTEAVDGQDARPESVDEEVDGPADSVAVEPDTGDDQPATSEDESAAEADDSDADDDAEPTRVISRVEPAQTDDDGGPSDGSSSSPTPVISRVSEPDDESLTQAGRAGAAASGDADGTPAHEADSDEPTDVTDTAQSAPATADETPTGASPKPDSTAGQSPAEDSESGRPDPDTGVSGHDTGERGPAADTDAGEPTGEADDEEPAADRAEPNFGEAATVGGSDGDSMSEGQAADPISEEPAADVTGGEAASDTTADPSAAETPAEEPTAEPPLDGPAVGTTPADAPPDGEGDQGDPWTDDEVRTEYGETAVEFAQFWGEHDLDFEPTSLGRLDDLVDAQWNDERFAETTFGSDQTFDDRAFTSVVTELGSYFGEVLVRHLDGAWTDETSHEAAVVVSETDRQLAVPVFQVAITSLRERPVFARSYDALLDDLGRDGPTR